MKLKQIGKFYMRNHNGQVMIAFVLILPILLMCMGLVIDSGLLYIEKRKLDNVVEDVVEYGMKHMTTVTEEELTEMLYQNIDEIDILKIEIKDTKVEIQASYQKQSIFRALFKKNDYEISSHYKGIMANDKIKIVRG